MALLAATRVEMAWVCPECGHGSPEPRDRHAHLDAHRQLRQFIDAWDAAAAADQAAERRRRRRPLYALVTVLVVAVLAAFTYWGVGGRDVASVAPAGPAPGVQIPGAGSSPAPPAAAPAPSPSPAPPAPRAAPAVPVAAPQPPPSAPPADGGAQASPPAPAPGQPTSPTESVDAVPPVTGASPAPLVTVRGCVLVVCLNLGR